MEQADEVLQRAQAGDRDAFHALYLAHHASLYRYVYGELLNADDAQDVVQETFIRGWTALGRFREESSLVHWLIRIARNLIIDRARARKRRPEVTLETPLGESGTTLGDLLASRQAGPAEQAETADDQRRFHRALAGLPGAQRAVFLLREWEGLSYADIADREGTTEGTVKSRLARARAALATALHLEHLA